MEWVETTGRSVEEAKEAALDELGVDEQDADFEIVAEARLGLFGRLRSEARVRARVRPTAPRAKDDRRRKRRRPGADGGSEPTSDHSKSSALESPAGTDPAPQPASTKSAEPHSPAGPRRNQTRSGGNAQPSETVPTSTIDDPTVDPAPSGSPSPSDGSSPASDRPRRSRGGNQRPTQTSSNEHYPAALAGSQHPEEDGQVEVPLEEQAKVAEAFLRGLADEMGLAAQISTTQDGQESIEVTMEGPDLGLLIGPKGATLLALQDLTRTVVQRKTSASNGRLWVDVSGYRHKRAAALSRFAQQVANEVLSSGNRKAMEPMNAADRKVVHDTINDIAGVATLSEGEDAERRVVVYAVTETE